MNYCPICKTELHIIQLETEDRERVVCSSGECKFIHYDNPTPVVAAVVEYNGQILLAHNVLWPPSWYALITGFLEKNEDPIQGVVRELKEETNLDAQEVNFINHYTFERMNQLIIAFHVRATGDIKLNEELDDYKLFDKDKVRYWDSGTGYALRDYIKSVMPNHVMQLFERPGSTKD